MLGILLTQPMGVIEVNVGVEFMSKFGEDCIIEDQMLQSQEEN